MWSLIKNKYSAVFLCLLSLFIWACASPTPSEKIAEDFIQAYYVNHNQKMALNLASGLAAEKIRVEEHLLQGTSPASERERPEVTYKKISMQSSAQHVRLVYRLTISIPALKRKIERKVFLKLREQQGAWKVTQFGDDAASS